MSNGATRAAGSGSPIGVDGTGSVSIDFGHEFYDCGCGKKANPHTHNQRKAQIEKVVITGLDFPITIPINGKKAKVEVFLQNHK